MGSLTLNGATSGQITINPPAVAGTTAISLPAITGGSFIVSDSSGNVGIGTTSPNGTLDLRGTYQQVQSSDAQVLGSLTQFKIQRNGNDTRLGIGYTTANDAWNISASYGSTGAYKPLAFATSDTERMRIDTSGYMQGTVNGLGAGRIPAMQYYRLNADLAGANVNTAQSVLGVGVTLVGSTQYAFEAIYAGYKTVGTTSHSIGFGFGGTATLNNIAYFAIGDNLAGGFPSYLSGNVAHAYTNTASNTTFIAATGTAAVNYFVRLSGTISVNAGGTFIPQYTLSAAPGGAYTTAAGSYFAIWPLAASGSNVSIGSWA